jgi:hypothetical protein
MKKRSQSKKPKRGRSEGPLLSPQATGGLTATAGFDFQDRYAVCHVPVWLQRGLRQVFSEGTGDVDVRFAHQGAETRVHFQVKDHEVAPTELREVVSTFAKIDSKMLGVYQSFTLVCPSLSVTLRALERDLARFRNAKPFYDNIPDALASTRDEVVGRLKNAGLEKHITFALEKLYFDVGHTALKQDDGDLHVFISRLLSHPDFATKLREMVIPAFGELARAMSQHRGKVLDREVIDDILRKAVLATPIARPSVTLWVHNWTREKFDLPADYTIDWSEFFDRETRKAPSQSAWNDVLLPELRNLRKQIAADRTERVIRFRGKCALSAGWAIGSAFPVVGGWVFEVPQPPSQEIWKTDDSPTPAYSLRAELIDGDSNSADLILVLNVKGEARAEVLDYGANVGLRQKATLVISPPTEGGRAIGGSADAAAYAIAARDTVGEVVKKHGITRTHVFYYGPLALAIFLGQHFSSVGELQLYEFKAPGYNPAGTLTT